MRDYCEYVDVFQGCDEIDIPRPEGVAAEWRFIKGLCGNNSPAAALPFGRLVAGCYSGGYSAGYGRLKVNCGGPIEKLYDKNKVIGFSLLQNDGTGYINTFYNYAVATPMYGELSARRLPRDFTDESARPGYYALTTEQGIECEMTVSPRAALERYRFPRPGGRLVIDFSNDGLYERTLPGKCRLELKSASEIEATVELHGLTIYFCAVFEGGAGPLRLWADDAEVSGNALTLPGGEHSFGCLCDAPEGGEARVRIGLSPKSMEIARADATGETRPFDEVARSARDTWNEALSAIDASFDDEEDARIFYSNFYHTLIKPCDWSGESFLYDEHDFVLDFATLWDQYKTQLPLIYSLYPEISLKIANTMLSAARATGRMPHEFMLDNDHRTDVNDQARMLAEYTLADAFLRGVPFDVHEAARLIYDDAFNMGHYDDFMAGGAAEGAYAIDITDACAAAALIARAAGRTDEAERFERVAARWAEPYDADTGLARAGKRYYEGSHWNYSFRLISAMAERVEFAGGRERFVGLLDAFFGYTEGDGSRFEGFNNETDMETPYAYHFAGRHDRIAEVVDAGMKFMFRAGRGGVPGNNDSGGLSSCYIWNALGVFPVSGRDMMIIGTPRVKRARLKLANGCTLTIEREGEGIYVKEATRNGVKLADLTLSAGEFMAGGTLKFAMGREALK